jgi:hypothetical protein
MASLSVSSQVARRDFSSKTLRALSRKGVELVGVQALPDMSSDMPFANAERGFVVADNGTARVWTFAQVLGAAK